MHPEPTRRPPAGRRPRGAAFVVALLLVLGSLLSGTTTAATATAAAAPRADGDAGGDPLKVTLTAMSPSTLGARTDDSEPLTLRGRVRNTSEETWRDVNVTALTSTTPITTEKDLTAAAGSAADSFIGNRLTSANAFVPVGDVGPGDTASFILRVPRDELGIPDDAGVYWVGVHALGTGDEGRIVAGRARTFLPLVKRTGPTVRMSVVLPVRHEVRRTADLRLANPDAWDDLVSEDGRLGRLLGLVESAGRTPVSLLVDPAVLEAVETLGAGNETNEIGAAPAEGEPTESPSASDDGGAENPGDQPSTPPTTDTPSGDREDQPDDADAEAARTWLTRAVAVMKAQRTFGLAYADPDTAALADRDPDLLGLSRELATGSFQHFGLTAPAITAPADGVLPTDAVAALDAGTTVLVTDQATGGGPARRTAPSGQSVVVADSSAVAGGPAPGATTSALAMRQRILGEAALRAIAGSNQPMVVSLPHAWDPGHGWEAADFFGGLQNRWLSLVSLDASPGGPPTTRLAYPASAERRQISAAQLGAAQRIADAVDVFVGTLPEPGDAADLLSRLTLDAVSYHARQDPTTLSASRALPAGIRARMAGIRIDVGTDLVTMSGKTGLFTVTLVNELDHPVRVGVRARSAADLRITAPDPVVLAAGARTTVRLRAAADATGVRVVQVSPVTSGGDEVGTPTQFSVRSSQVSSLVWGVMAGAFGVLVVAIVRRAVRRGLRRPESSTE